MQDKKVEDLRFILPQTMEECRGDIVFKEEKVGTIEIINLLRVEQ